ncbi:MAG: CinA domain-containing protein [Comamonadaceae bacterium]|nr:MAG: CinA domain-containing protein [Comamonadaceae bacterium]
METMTLQNNELLAHDLCALVANLLLENGWMLVTAESCTGGLIAAACTDLAGSSTWFERGIVSYSNAAKTELLGVDAQLIEQHGAVSEPVVRAMAAGALAHAHAQVALAVTGVAGPGGGSADKPVGTVWFGWAIGNQITTQVQHFSGDRAAVRQTTVQHALASLVELLRSKESRMKLLIVEDDPMMGAGLHAALTEAGFVTHWVTNGAAALELLETESFRAMVLDITLPGLDGLSLLKQLRAQDSKLPVLMLTARDTTRDKVMCFDAGADDFLVKTTDMEELIARLRALIRRAGYIGRIKVGNLVLDADAQSVTQDGKWLALSNREFELLQLLMENAGQVVTRSRLEQSLFGLNRAGESNVLEVHIHNLRQKLGDSCLKTVRGVGYALAAE